jgi:hypothetical protein
MGRASHGRSANFSLEKMIEHTISFYRQVAFGPRHVASAPDLKISASR